MQASYSSRVGDSEDQSTVPLGIRFNSHKAGLGNLQDGDKIARTVAEAARGGRFYENEARKEAELVEHVKSVRERVRLAPSHSAAADAALAQAESERQTGNERVIVCVDFDCFFSAVEALDNPALRGKPHAVGGGKNGVLSTSSYEARVFGVRSAMPTFIALKLCPQLILVRSRFHRYQEISKLVAKKVFAVFDPKFEMRSLDEALLDITDYVDSSSASVAEVVQDLRARVTIVTGGLTASCGIASSRMLAKIGADVNKPAGQFMAPTSRDGIVNFMSALPVRKIPGIGKVTERVLSDAFNVKTVGQIIERRAELHHVLRLKTFHFLICAALGISSALVDSSVGGPRKGMSRERTFHAVSDREKLMRITRDISLRLSADVVATGGRITGGRTVSIKLKQADFRIRSRSRKMRGPVGCDGDVLFKAAWTLVERELPIEARLLGVRLTDLTGTDIDNADEAHKNQTRIERFFHAGCDDESDSDSESIPGCPPATQPDDGKNAAGVTSKGDDAQDDLAQFVDTAAVEPPAELCVPGSQMICPVCNVCSFSGLILLNKHMDACLSLQSADWKNASRALEGGGTPRGQAKRPRSAGIDCYLTRQAHFS
jgi:DNA polymerase kappa